MYTHTLLARNRCYLLTATLALWGSALSSQEKPVDVEITSHVTKPEQIPVTPQGVAGLKAPAGFKITTFAEKLGKPRIIAVAGDGVVYVTRREPGDCLMLKDTDGDGRVDQQKVVAQKPQLHGIAIDGDRVYFATVNEVYVATRNSDGTLGALKQILSGLPDGGQHANRTLAIGPDRMLYISVGSTCNACTETGKESATLLRTSLDGSSRSVFASGLRNTIGFAWHPETKELWSMDHGIDWLGDNQQGEELNLLVQGGQYGWPYVYGKSQFNPQDEPKGGVTHEQWAKMSKEPLLLYTAHSAPMQIVFASATTFPQEYKKDAFVTMRGSWNRKPPSGYEVVRIRFSNGKPTAIEPFISGFLTQKGSGWAQMGRPVGLAVAKDGSLLVGDDANGVIYRVAH